MTTVCKGEGEVTDFKGAVCLRYYHKGIVKLFEGICLTFMWVENGKNRSIYPNINGYVSFEISKTIFKIILA